MVVDRTSSQTTLSQCRSFLDTLTEIREQRANAQSDAELTNIDRRALELAQSIQSTFSDFEVDLSRPLGEVFEQIQGVIEQIERSELEAKSSQLESTSTETELRNAELIADRAEIISSDVRGAGALESIPPKFRDLAHKISTDGIKVKRRITDDDGNIRKELALVVLPIDELAVALTVAKRNGIGFPKLIGVMAANDMGAPHAARLVDIARSRGTSPAIASDHFRAVREEICGSIEWKRLSVVRQNAVLENLDKIYGISQAHLDGYLTVARVIRLYGIFGDLDRVTDILSACEEFGGGEIRKTLSALKKAEKFREEVPENVFDWLTGESFSSLDEELDCH